MSLLMKSHWSVPTWAGTCFPELVKAARAVPVTEPDSTIPPTFSPVPNRVEVECPVPRPSRRSVLVAEGEHVRPTLSRHHLCRRRLTLQMTTWLQHSNLEGDVVASSSAFALPVRNRFSVPDSTVRDNDDLVSTTWKCFSMSDR